MHGTVPTSQSAKRDTRTHHNGAKNPMSIPMNDEHSTAHAIVPYANGATPQVNRGSARKIKPREESHFSSIRQKIVVSLSY